VGEIGGEEKQQGGEKEVRSSISRSAVGGTNSTLGIANRHKKSDINQGAVMREGKGRVWGVRGVTRCIL